MTISDLSFKELDVYYERYINKLDNQLPLLKAFEIGLLETTKFFQEVPEAKLLHRYEIGKWTIKEVFQHLIDTERIFMYRCFRIARRDKTSLAGFNQQTYTAPSGSNEKSMDKLLLEFQCGRRNSITILESLSDNDLAFIGNANESVMSARAAAFVIPGHDIWHMEIIKDLYL